MTDPTFEVKIGRLLCSTYRDYLEGMQFKHSSMRFREGKGWIERIFMVSGPQDVVAEVARDTCAWIRRMEAE